MNEMSKRPDDDPRPERPRYAMERMGYAYEIGQDHALYDIVDNIQGTPRVMASRVRYHDALGIVNGLNGMHQYRTLMSLR